MPLSSILNSAPSWVSRFVSVETADGPTNKGAISLFGRPVKNPRGSSAPVKSCDPLHGKRASLTESRKKSNYFRSEVGIFKALIEGTSRHTLGRGLSATSLCEEKDWALRANDYFEERTATKKFSIREDLTFKQAQKVILPDVITDGDAGAAPVRARDGSGRVQLFPADAIANGGPVNSPYGTGRWEDGILRRDGVEPIAYRILQKGHLTTTKVGYRDFPAERFWHVGRQDRINCNRPYPWLHHGADAGVNIVDLRALEMAKTKLNSYFAGTIKTRNGAIPAGLDAAISREMEGEIAPVEGEDPEAAVARAERRMTELYGQAALLPLEDGEEFEFLTNNHQPMTVTSFIDYLIADIAVGFGVPSQFIWALTGMAGPFSRMVLQQADWFFQDVADMMVSDFCQPIWEAIIADGMWSGDIPAPPAGVNWKRVQWQGPGALTIDKGRDGKLFRDMVLSGMGRRSTWHELNGLNGDAENSAAIDEIARLMQECDEKGVPHHYFFGRDYQGSATAGETTTGSEIDLEDLVERLAERLRDAA